MSKRDHSDLALNDIDLLNHKDIPFDLPSYPIALMCYQQETIDTAIDLGYHSLSSKLSGDLYIKNGGSVVISKPHGIGSPIAAMVIEELAVLGVNTLVEFGTTGSLQNYLEYGDCIICDQALRGEGTSLYYQKNGRFSKPNSHLLREVRKIITASVGIIWTTDAPYRETNELINHYSNLGYLGVNMETSAVYTTCKTLGIRAVSICVISDKPLTKNFIYSPQKTKDSLRKNAVRLLKWLENIDH